MKKILVTGAGGFVGSRVMQQWAWRYDLCSFPKGFLATAGEDAVRQAVLQQVFLRHLRKEPPRMTGCMWRETRSVTHPAMRSGSPGATGSATT